MAPTAVSPRRSPASAPITKQAPQKKVAVEEYNPFHNPFKATETEADKTYAFPDLKPCFPKDIITAPYEAIPNVVDRGTYADPEFPHLHDIANFDNLEVNIGTELHPLDPNGEGDRSSTLQLKNFTGAQKDELARLVAERGVVVLRNQDLTPDQLVAFGSYFGAPERPLHQHPSSGVPRRRGLDDVHVVWHDETMRPSDAHYTATDLWHADMSQELNSLGLTALYNITNPVQGGGDTLFSSGYGLYDALSPQMQTYLESLSALHSGVDQSNGAAGAGLHIRRPAVESVHPLIRVHPVTGWKSVYVNPAFTRSIVGVPKIESDRILGMLYDLMGSHSDLTLRVRWQQNTIVLWDNRTNAHSATYDHWRPDPNCRRHALRVASTAEMPSQTLPDGSEGRSRKEDIWEQQGLDISAMRALRAQKKKGGFKD